MNKRWRAGIPALLAVALFMLAELLRLSKVLSQHWESTEVICNALMIGIAIFFSAKERFFGQEQSPSSHRIVWILSISLIAFPMNIDVFKHLIRWEHLPTDLWGWHIFWIIFAVLQLLVLTPLGKEILVQMKLLLVQIKGLFTWGKSVAFTLGEIVFYVFDQILTLIKQSSKKMIFIIVLGICLWGCWLVTQVSRQDIYVLLADITFIGKNLLVWFDYLLVALLVCLLPSVVRKIREGLLGLDTKYVMKAIAAAVILAASAFLLPFLLDIIGILLVLIGSLIAIVKWAAKMDRKKFNLKDADSCPQNPKDSSPDGAAECKESATLQTFIRMEDVTILLALFAALPLGALFFLALLTLDGQKGSSDPVAWLELWKTSIEIANGMMQLFGTR